MTTLLVTISLLLHGVTFLWIMTLLQKQQSVQTTDINKVKNEIEDLLVSYTAEMKEKNELLLEEIQDFKTYERPRNQPISSESHSVRDLKENHHKPIDEKPTVERKIESEYKDYQPPLIEMEEESVYEQSDSAKVMALSKQGFSTNDIAKKLNLGKGEVELMLKFHQ